MPTRWQGLGPCHLLCTIVVALPVLSSCGDDGGGLAPPPDQIVVGAVTIERDPLRLRIAGEPGMDQERFLEIATVAAVDTTHYYDARDLGDDDLTWSVPGRAIGVDGDGWLVVEGGARLRLIGDGEVTVLELDSRPVPGAVLHRLVLPIDSAGGEPIYGFGESFGGADAAGQVREAQFRVDPDSESGLNEAHVPVPLALWPARGIGLFVADRRSGAFDLGAARPGEVLTTFAQPERGPLAIELFTDDTPLDLVRSYVARTGKPAVPPRWALAPQQWRNQHDSSDQVRDDATQMRALGIPGSLMWIDNPWQTGYNTFVFDEERFVAIDALIAELKTLGYRVLVWSTPYLQEQGVTADDHDEARAAGFLVRDDTGAPIPFPWKEGPVGLIDFTNPDAAAFWQQRIARVVDRGISGFKLDYGEDVVPELGGTIVQMRLAGGDNTDLHGIFARGYHQTYLQTLPDGDGFLITRAGAWGTQDRNTCIWPGDLDSDFSRHGVDNGDGARNVGGLPAAIAGGLSLSVSGFPFYGSDIGGYREGTPTSEALIRWTQYAALGTVMQLGGGGPSHNPWDTALFDPPALDVYREYSRLHMDLNPTLWTLAQQAGLDGTPVTRPCRFVFPAAGCDDAMFLLGDALLVAPVIEAGATTRQVVLPAGRWIDWWTGEVIDGDGATAITVDAPLTRMPIWLADGAMVAMFARAADTLEPATAPGVTSYADPAYGRELRLVAAPAGAVTLHDGASASASLGALAFTPGSQYDVATFELRTWLTAPTAVTVGGAPLPAAASDAEVDDCAAPGCWYHDAVAARLRVRVDATDGVARTLAIE